MPLIEEFWFIMPEEDPSRVCKKWYASNSLHVKPTGPATSILGFIVQFGPSDPLLWSINKFLLRELYDTFDGKADHCIVFATNCLLALQYEPKLGSFY
jgi:hypothetical protein